MATSMRGHPDIQELRARYDVAAERPTAQLVDGLTFMTGLYLAMSPWVVGFDDLTTLAVSNLISGTALAALCMGLASAYSRTHGIAWVAPLIGVWAIVSPWIVSGDVSTTSSLWSNLPTGIVAVVLGVAATSVGLVRGR